MLQLIYRKINNDKGFTLIELMVVILILGILASIAIPRFVSKKAEAVDSRVKADIKIIQNAVDLFYIEKNRYPVAIEELVNTGYLKEVPKNPRTGYPYNYEDETGQITD